MKRMDLVSMTYLIKPDTTDIWELKNEAIFHEQQCGNYSFIVIKNKKKSYKKNEMYEELTRDFYVRE